MARTGIAKGQEMTAMLGWRFTCSIQTKPLAGQFTNYNQTKERRTIDVSV
jgi:hypothetical protein